jgi:hypothetical protein
VCHASPRVARGGGSRGEGAFSKKGPAPAGVTKRRCRGKLGLGWTEICRRGWGHQSLPVKCYDWSHDGSSICEMCSQREVGLPSRARQRQQEGNKCSGKMGGRTMVGGMSRNQESGGGGGGWLRLEVASRPHACCHGQTLGEGGPRRDLRPWSSITLGPEGRTAAPSAWAAVAAKARWWALRRRGQARRRRPAAWRRPQSRTAPAPLQCRPQGRVCGSVLVCVRLCVCLGAPYPPHMAVKEACPA